ncbi:branched chain amino acid aminotransferase apoenzyme [Anaeromyces robustus]|jgi:branched-chain amino acid aminotransferase|uniref:Branched chain amino acid aminotransferase apoenzyme n=1 Tax=Anaeromyces robustus TaxID=1754192 RepID=A0A1Y1X0G8_9FUNG|nr:branched chain amino acid aminotransferase apoenzyme [Anaeromyces robustus]|eukprot:ORX79243.1 branched chain amino acid aminotransferase apoenzyme [Anaeromyces robustus]
MKLDINTPDFKWNELGFKYHQTNCHIIYKYKDGKWDDGELVEEPFLKIHIAATALHYGQTGFEGLKAFRMKDGKIRVFRPQANAERIISTCEYTMMAAPTVEMFLDGVRRVIAANIEYVPPYGSGASLYIRPVFFGTEARVGVSSAEEYALIIFVDPVSDYYKGGMSNPVKSLIMANTDRAAPYGTGHVKIGGNYVATVRASHLAKKRGYPILLFLDSASKTYIEEFATSNFFALTPTDSNGKRHYITPDSHSILHSITNMSLEKVAKDILGWEVERRKIPFKEVEEGKFNEIAACGTAVVITPIGEIDHEIVKEDGSIVINKHIIGDGKTVGSGLLKLQKTLIDIQNGEREDPFQWMWPSNGIEAEN